MNTMELVKVLENRKSVKKYDPKKKLTEEQLNTVLKAIKRAPSSMGYEPYRVLVISNEELKKELNPGIMNQPAAIACSHLLLFVSLTEAGFNDLKNYQHRWEKFKKLTNGTVSEEDFKKGGGGFLAAYQKEMGNLSEWCRKQAYIALGFAMLTAASIGIGSGAMEGFTNSALKEMLAKKNLIDKKNEDVAVIMTLGFADETNPMAYNKSLRDEDGYKFKIIK